VDKTSLAIAGAILVLLGITAFLMYGNPPSQEDSLAASAVAFTQIAEGYQAQVPERVNYVLTTPTELEALWKLLSDAGPMPAVDFSRYDLLALFAGSVPSYGYSIRFTDMTITDSKRLVSIAISKPMNGCVVAQATAAPYQIVIVPRSTLPLAHEDTHLEVPCD
jgi:hypothetical protein